jgi:superfamily II DNA/RNA helicase
MFSATLPNEILKMAAKYLKNPVRISVGSTTTPIEKIDQKHIHVSETDKYMKLVDELEAREGSIVVFAKTKYGAEKLAKRLYQRRLSVDALHGGLRQNRREKIIQAFRKQKFRILVATDVASRGLDVPHVEHVINYDLPQVPEDYIHRIGRTARAGAEGSALSLLTSKDRGKWNAICRLLDPQFKGGKEDKNEGRFGQSRKSGRNRHRGGGKAKDRTQNQPGNQSSGGYSVRRPSINDDSRPKSNWKKPSQRGPKRRKAA